MCDVVVLMVMVVIDDGVTYVIVRVVRRMNWSTWSCHTVFAVLIYRKVTSFFNYGLLSRLWGHW